MSSNPNRVFCRLSDMQPVFPGCAPDCADSLQMDAPVDLHGAYSPFIEHCSPWVKRIPLSIMRLVQQNALREISRTAEEL